jgi:hypothetical protein
VRHIRWIEILTGASCIVSIHFSFSCGIFEGHPTCRLAPVELLQKIGSYRQALAWPSAAVCYHTFSSSDEQLFGARDGIDGQVGGEVNASATTMKDAYT